MVSPMNHTCKADTAHYKQKIMDAVMRRMEWLQSDFACPDAVFRRVSWHGITRIEYRELVREMIDHDAMLVGVHLRGNLIGLRPADWTPTD